MGHVIWTLEEAAAAIPRQKDFWLSNCGCREDNGSKCSKGLQVCLGFSEEATSTPHGREKISRDRVQELLAFAREQKLVPRPYLDEAGTVTALCLCCPCCCSYIKGSYPNIAGKSIETTDMAACNSCGACVDLCYFGARKLEYGALKVDKAKCYGCGVCVADCPSGAIKMAKR